MLEFLDKNFKAAIIIKDVKENMVVMIEKKGISTGTWKLFRRTKWIFWNWKVEYLKWKIHWIANKNYPLWRTVRIKIKIQWTEPRWIMEQYQVV